MKERVLLELGQVSTWTSCQYIVPNLKKSFWKCFPGASSYTIGMDDSRLFEKISHSDRDLDIYFLDHHLPGHDFLKVLFEQAKRENITFIIQIFGDFTLKTPSWLYLSEIACKVKVKFLVASEAQRKLLAKFLIHSESLSIIHFPLSSDDFFYDNQDKWRRKLSISQSENMILYTGRLSLQKNITRLMSSFEKFPSNTHLVLVGYFDDLWAPMFGLESYGGSYQERILFQLKNMSEHVRKRIHLVGPLDSKSEMREIYSEADLFVSLSTFHDEDYGYSPLEALFCGTRCILTAWGGYKEFNGPGIQDYIPVLFREGALYLDEARFDESVVSALKQKYFLNKRSEVSRFYKDNFSIEKIAEKFCQVDLSEAKPLEFTSLLSRHAKLISSRQPICNLNSGSNSLYQEIYGGYF